MQRIYSIYKITNRVNGKAYIGFTSQRTGRGRFWWHLSGLSQCPAICRAAKKYGRSAFDCEVVYQSKDRDHTLTVMEPYFIKAYQSFGPRGYNVTAGGEGTPGYKRTPEQVQRMRERSTGRTASQETRRRMAEAQRSRPKGELHPNFGRKRTPQDIQRQVANSVGKKRSAETRRKQSESLKVRGSGVGKIGAKHIQAKRYVIERNDGTRFDVIGLSQFCREHPIYSASGLCMMATGKLQRYRDIATIKCLGTIPCEYCRVIFEHTGRIHCPMHAETTSLPTGAASLMLDDGRADSRDAL